MTIKYLAGNVIQGESSERPASPNYTNETIFTETDTHKSYIWNSSTSKWTQLT